MKGFGIEDTEQKKEEKEELERLIKKYQGCE